MQITVISDTHNQHDRIRSLNKSFGFQLPQILLFRVLFIMENVGY